MDIRIRSAREEDAAFLARIMLMAGRAHGQRGIWDAILGVPDDECLTFLEALSSTGEPHLYHWSGYIIAEVDGHRAAALGGFDPLTSGMEAMMRALPEVFQKLAIPESDQEAAFQRHLRLQPAIPDHRDDSWIIDGVATHPEFRRRGILDRLLAHIIEEGRSRDFRRAQLTMTLGNMPALRAYEKRGFRVVEERRHPDFEALTGAPGMIRLVCDL